MKRSSTDFGKFNDCVIQTETNIDFICDIPDSEVNIAYSKFSEVYQNLYTFDITQFSAETKFEKIFRVVQFDNMMNKFTILKSTLFLAAIVIVYYELICIINGF